MRDLAVIIVVFSLGSLNPMWAKTFNPLGEQQQTEMKKAKRSATEKSTTKSRQRLSRHESPQQSRMNPVVEPLDPGSTAVPAEKSSNVVKNEPAPPQQGRRKQKRKRRRLRPMKIPADIMP